jgi:hypothetical protein
MACPLNCQIEDLLIERKVPRKRKGIKKKIGIKYCGGCNPTYERLEVIQAVQSRLGDRFLFIRPDQRDLDGMLLINGCVRSCATENFDHRETAYFSISGEKDFELLIDWLTALGKREDT